MKKRLCKFEERDHLKWKSSWYFFNIGMINRVVLESQGTVTWYISICLPKTLSSKNWSHHLVIPSTAHLATVTQIFLHNSVNLKEDTFFGSLGSSMPWFASRNMQKDFWRLVYTYEYWRVLQINKVSLQNFRNDLCGLFLVGSLKMPSTPKSTD